MTLQIRHLRADDDRSSFHSGNADLDRFFLRYAGQNQFRHHLGATWVVVDGATILGFATVAPAEVTPGEMQGALRKRLPVHSVPVLRLARLAVDSHAQGRGLGAQLLRFVFVLARRLAGDFGCVGVLVDAKPEAIEFYQRYGFHPLELLQGGLGDRPRPVPMFLELGAIPDEAE